MNKIIITLFLLSVFLINFLPVKDPDFGWHYRCGKENCTTNKFSYFLPDYKAAYPGYLYDKSLAFIYDNFGFTGVSIAGATVMTLTAYLFFQITNYQLLITSISFYLILFLSWPVLKLGLRPQLFTYLFFLLTLFILQKAKKNKFRLFILPLLFLIWVNTHIGFFIGLIILLFYVIDNFIRLSHDRRILVIITILSFTTTIFNPFGISVYREILNHAISPLNNMVAEWTSPALWQKLIIISGIFFYLFIIIRKKILPVFETLLLVFFALLSFKGVRNVPFFYTVFFYVIARNGVTKSPPWRDPAAAGQSDGVRSLRFARDDILAPILISLTIFFAIINIPQTISFNQSWIIYCHKGAARYPCGAIKNYPSLSGNVYAAYEWGGFLIWQKPDIKVFVDGRMPAWKDAEGQSPYQVYLEILQNKPGWNEKLRKLKTDYLLIMPNTFMDLLLQKEAGKYHWQEKYRDDVAVIYKNIYN